MPQKGRGAAPSLRMRCRFFWNRSNNDLLKVLRRNAMGSLTQEQVDQFRREGYLLVKGLFDPAEDLDPLIAEYEGVLDDLANDLYAKGEISSTYADLPFSERMIEVCKESGKVHAQYFD